MPSGIVRGGIVSQPVSRGYHISFAGVDGAGKTVQATLLYRWLRAGGRSAYLWEGDDEFALEALRTVAIGEGEPSIRRFYPHEVLDVVKAVEAVRGTALVATPLLANSRIVVSPRSAFDILAVARAYDSPAVEQVAEILELLSPADLTFWLELGLDEARARVRRRSSDVDERSFVERYARELERIGEAEGWQRVSAVGRPEDVHERVRAVVAAKLGDELDAAAS
jgi:dTMP kinase